LSAGASKRAKRPVPSHRFFGLCQTLEERLEPVAAALRYALLSSAPAELLRIKDRDHTLGFDDLLRQVADALRGPQGSALAQGLQQRYRAALIDEFQDTDPLQWSIFQRAFTGPSTHLYLVGDPKQAIYSFRGADVFAYLRARTRADRCYSLGENWRSSGALVGAVNRLFGDHPSPFALPEIDYRPVTAAGRADATPLEIPGDSTEPLRFWFWNPAAEGFKSEPAWTARLAAATAEEIVRLLSSGARIGGRTLAPGDLAVLVDKHEQAAAVAEALAQRRVPSVRQTQESVFATREAEDLQMLLDALSEGAGDAQRRAALLTVLVHVGPEELAAQRDGADDGNWDAWRERLGRWRDRWMRDGVLAMLESVLRTRNTRARLLATAEGERRLTNYLHLGELLQQAATVQRLPPHALAGWLSEQRARAATEPKGAEETLLRLERDAAAVQLVTIHRSKGLEYPVVFCPFPGRAVDQGLKRGGTGGRDDVLFHDPDAEYALCHDVGTPEFESHRRMAVGERLAENLRLVYVALTRARHRCYVGWSAGGDSGRRAWSWLLCPPPDVRTLALADAPEALEALVKAKTVAEQREAAGRWTGLGIAVDDLPRVGETPWVPSDHGPKLGAARVFRGEIRRDWGPSSFSALVRGVPEEQAGQESADADRQDSEAPEFVAGPLDAFRGSRAGICLHEILEQLDFAASDSAVRACVRDRLRSNGFPEETLGDPVSEWVGRVLAAPLLDGSPLRDVPQADGWRELEFLLPLRSLSPARLAAAFASGPPGALGTALAPSLSRLVFPEVRGVLGGFIDLVCRSGSRWWLVDWKSNWLGSSVEAYSAGALSREMNAEHYGLQYHLYVLALHRLLKARIPDYDYDRDFGGVRYVFVRGVTPGRPGLGVFADRPPRALIETLEGELLEAAP
ncbi:MAG: UvrD-helicase domain-containing protein, partial [Verrucomicrobiales bacterium]|nr:UvrD-helicase domain-containing protein [Verrucomicrobiales bacterium]